MLTTIQVVAAASLAAAFLAAPAAMAAPTYVPGELLVEYAPATTASVRMAAERAVGAGAAWPAWPGASSAGAGEAPQVLELAPGSDVASAVARLRRTPGVRLAVPDYIAHMAGAPAPAAPVPATAAAGTEAERAARAEAIGLADARARLAAALTPAPPVFIPVNTGAGHTPGGWEGLQWNFAGSFGVGAPQAWGNLIADRAPGGRGVTIAVLDTGIAFRNWKRFRRSPGFSRSQFVPGRDFVNPRTPPLDRNGHGTFVAGEIAEETNVPYGLTGLAYGVRLMPVRVLNTAGEGDALTIARGIRFAVEH
ncbi:MAG: S8 family serine peptidase, partial [Acidobacteriota bacterium]|nr:S8 family serine peptidase [Acidobacteriota bacterium]